MKKLCTGIHLASYLAVFGAEPQGFLLRNPQGWWVMFMVIYCTRRDTHIINTLNTHGYDYCALQDCIIANADCN